VRSKHPELEGVKAEGRAFPWHVSFEICYHMIASGCPEERPLASRKEVRDLILELRLTLAREGTVRFDERAKNLQTMADLNLLEPDVAEILRKITEDDYCQGPLKDDQGRPLEWWVFGPSVSGCCVYVKVSLYRGKVICKSFHLPEWPMRYPLRMK
jgi:hypothetical protein